MHSPVVAKLLLNSKGNMYMIWTLESVLYINILLHDTCTVITALLAFLTSFPVGIIGNLVLKV